MAYYNNPYYPQNFYPNIQQQQMQAQQPPQQMQNGGFIVIPSEDMVKNYPVAAGNCVTFKIEGKPVVMEKSVGFSQFDAPTINRYRLVKEDMAEPQGMPQNGENGIEAVKSTINGLKGEIDALWREIDGIKTVPKKTPAKKKEITDDDAE